METVTISIEVTPDLVMIKHEKERYSTDKMIFRKYSYIFSHDMCLIRNVDEAGNPIGYSDPEFFAVRLKDGKVQVLDKKWGWLADLEATEKYAELIAEKELLK